MRRTSSLRGTQLVCRLHDSCIRATQKMLQSFWARQRPCPADPRAYDQTTVVSPRHKCHEPTVGSLAHEVYNFSEQGEPDIDPKYYSPNFWDPKLVPLIWGNPHLCKREQPLTLDPYILQPKPQGQECRPAAACRSPKVLPASLARMRIQCGAHWVKAWGRRG